MGDGRLFYLQQPNRVGLLADTPDPGAEAVHDLDLFPARLDLIPVGLKGKLHTRINEFFC